MGGLLQYKWEVYCLVSLSSRLRSQEGTAIQMGGGTARTNWRCTAVLPSRPVRVGVSELFLLLPGTKPIHAGKNFLGKESLHECMRGLYSHAREHSETLLRNYFPHICQILGGIHFGAKRCRACTPKRIQKKSGELFMYWFRARGYV